MRVLIIGGYGTFGFRLANLLKDEAGLDILLAGRSLSKARAACTSLSGHSATYTPLALDRNAPLAPQIDTLLDVIIDCSGPFQLYAQKAPNAQNYHVPCYAIAIGVHYFDIADAAEFVIGIGDLDADAQAAGVSVISGLSTYPCLTTAASTVLAKGLDNITQIKAGIAPSAKTAMGRSVLDAVLSYAGQPVGGGRYGLINGFNETIAVPGEPPLQRLPFSVIKAPDGHILREQFGSHIDVQVCAGSQPASLHYMLRGLARLSKWKLLPRLSRFSGLLYKVQSLITLGDARGGMFVRVEGVKDGATIARKWGVIAEGDIGPNIPLVPVFIIIKRLLAGETLPSGARHSAGFVSLPDYEAVFKLLGIKSGKFEVHKTGQTVFQTHLGQSFNPLPENLKSLHNLSRSQSYKGEANITRGKNPLSWIVAALLGFPKTGLAVPARVDIEITDSDEKWTRRFGATTMSSRLSNAKGRYAHYIAERFGAITVYMALTPEGEHLRYTVKHWSFLGLPLPRLLCPGGDVYEYEQDGRFHFHVDMKAPLFGRLVKYEGWLEPVIS